MGYYLAINGVQQGPFEPGELLARGLRPDTLVWTEGMREWQRADSVPELQQILAPAGAQPPPLPPRPVMYAHPAPGVTAAQAANNRVAAGVCGILLGSLGVHKFILGYTGAGVIMLLVTLLTCGLGGIVMSVIGIVEGVLYLTKTDEEFYQTYVLQQKQWF